MRNVIARIGNKWAFLVIMILDEKGTVRFNEFGREIPDVSSRVLAGTLRMLEADGLISRKAYAVVPPRVEYSLTEMGRSLVPLINEMTRWALQNMGDIMEHRRKSELPDGRKG